MARLGIPCPMCHWRRSRIVDTRVDLGGRRPRVWRVRRCAECQHTWTTAEIAPSPDRRSRVRLPDPARRLRELRSERHLLRRAGAA